MDYDDQLSEDLLQRFCPAALHRIAVYPKEKVLRNCSCIERAICLYFSNFTCVIPLREEQTAPTSGSAALLYTKHGRTVVLPGSGS